MSAKSTYHFEGYDLRPAGLAGDLLLALLWMQGDPDHIDMLPIFWTEQRPGRDSFLLSKDGKAIFFFKMHREGKRVELHIQFSPDKRENMRGLIAGLKWLESLLPQAGIEEIVFASKSPALIMFCRNRLGFDMRADGMLFKASPHIAQMENN